MEEPIQANSHEFPPDEPVEETTGSPPEPESPSAEPTDVVPETPIEELPAEASEAQQEAVAEEPPGVPEPAAEEVELSSPPEPPAMPTEFPPSPEPGPFLPPGQPPPATPYHHAQPIKDRSMGLILEILPGLFGIFGIGWIYAGETNTGVLILIGGLVMMFIFVTANVLSAGICCFGTIPIQLAVLAISTIKLNDFMKQHPETFR